MIGGRLTAQEAADRLGVKPATLYAYVSRGLVRRERSPDGRSLFALADVERLASRARRDRPPGPLTELRIESALTAIEDDAIFYRGEDLFGLALGRTFEEVAYFLWTGHLADGPPWLADPAAMAAAARVQAALPGDALPLDRLRVVVPALAATDPLRYETGQAAVVVTGRRLIAAMVDSLPRMAAEPPPLRVRRQRLLGSAAGRLWAGLTESRPPAGGLEALNAALVL